MPFSEENIQSLAQLRLTVYEQLQILPSAAREELWARTRAESETEAECTNCVAAGIECKPLATRLRCGFCGSRERVAKIGTRCSFRDDELYDRVNRKSYTRSVPREAFDKALQDILGELVDIDLVPSGHVMSGDLLKAAVESAKMLKEAESAIAKAKTEEEITNYICQDYRSRVEVLKEENNRLLAADRIHTDESKRMNATTEELKLEQSKLLASTQSKDETIAKLNNKIIDIQRSRDSWEQRYQGVSAELNEHRKNDLMKFIHSSSQQHLLSKALEENSHEKLRQAVQNSMEEWAATSARYHPKGLKFEEIETVLFSTPDKELSVSKRQRTDGDSGTPAPKRPASKGLTNDSLPSGSQVLNS